MTIGEALREGSARLAAAGIEGGARDVRRLMAEALGCDLDRVTLRAGDRLDSGAGKRFEAMLAARLQRRPVAQILGRRRFWGRDFFVTSDVLDPRPETEILVAAALAGTAPRRLLDLGTGSGAILLTLLAEWPGASGIGSDASAPALEVAFSNAKALGLVDRARFVQSDWTSGIDGAFDLVVCNPPYISAPEMADLSPEVRDWEPHAALTPGPTGLEAYMRLAPELPRLIEPTGRALFEFGAGQADAVAAIFRAAGFRDQVLHRDLDGRNRVIELRKSAQ